jgi:hypothetical protein
LLLFVLHSTVNTRHHLDAQDTLHQEARNARDGRPAPATQEAVTGELEMMLASPLFAQSNRCKGFLSYVVQETLAGRSDQLKERTIGVSVFDRAYDYDTGDDSIVRVTANDVRKRISQYYQESQAAHRVQIDLPRGSYVPEFVLAQKKRGRADDGKRLNGREATRGTQFDPATEAAAAQVEERLARQPVDAHVANAPEARSIFSRRPVQLAAVLLVVAAALAAAAIWRSRLQDSPPKLWESFVHANTPVLVCLGGHDIQDSRDSGMLTASGQPTVAAINIHRQMIPVDDASVIAALADQLGKRGIPFRLAGADQTSFTDFQRQPVILIGGMDNKWTLLMTQGLRYRITATYPAGPDAPPTASIIETSKPNGSSWSVDFTAPVAEWKKDYAIIARVDDPTAGVPVLIEAGLGSAGSIAASQLLISGAMASRLRGEPRCAAKTSFEAVLDTDIIEGKPGPPHILRLECW